MTFALPWALGIAGAASIVAVLLHLIATHRPEAVVLPTARFAPEGAARAASRTTRPTDRRLLALRVLALLLLGAAIAGPRLTNGRTALVRVFVADASRAAQSDVRDSVRALWRAGDAVVWFDSSARAAADSADRGPRNGADAPAPTDVRGRLSAGIISAHQHRRARLARADSVELVIVSPFLREEMDAAVAPLAARWAGRVRVVRSQPSPSPQRAVRTIGSEPNANDSAAARSGTTVVVWPNAGGSAGGSAGPVAPALADAVWARDVTVVAPLVRLPAAHAGAIVARWRDGMPAASETPLGAGCLRRVSIGVPPTGDLPLQPSFIALQKILESPCGGHREVASDSTVHVLAHPWPARGVSTDEAPVPRPPVASTLTLFALALAALLLEQVMRARAGGVR